MRTSEAAAGEGIARAPERAGANGGVEVLAIGMGASVAMWAVGYACRLPGVEVPGPIVLIFVLGCLWAAGVIAGRTARRGAWAGGMAGVVAGVVNLLVLGGLLTGDGGAGAPRSVWLWIPGSVMLHGAIAWSGAALGARRRGAATAEIDWTSALSRVAAAATFVLVVIGGLVTSHDAGLAVVDWPNSFGYAMFLYPISRMTGGIYYEHAHRLFGTLVGLVTVVQAVWIWRSDRRVWLRVLAAATVVLVVLQGILGGLRVTGHFTLSDSRAQTAPNLGLAVVHGVLGQAFLAAMIAVAVFASPLFKGEAPALRKRGAATDRALAVVAVPLLVVQLILGALQRHLSHGLMIHIAMAAAVASVVLLAGLRAWGLHREWKVLQRTGLILVIGVTAQLFLGLAAYVAIGAAEAGTLSDRVAATVATGHQAMGAALLAAVTTHVLWTHRLLAEPAR